MSESRTDRGVLGATRRHAVPPITRERARNLLPVIALTVLAAAVRFPFLDQSFWFDEAVTVQLVRQSLRGMLATLPHTESTPPLYYVLAWGWSRLFGTGEIGLRALSALLGTAAVPLSYGAGRVFGSHRAGLVAAALVACSPLLVWYSQEARSYSLLVFLSAASLLAFGSALRRPTRRAFAFWAVTAALALATHYFAVFLIGAGGLWLLLSHPRRRAAWAAVGAVVVAGASLLPLALYQEGSGRTAWISGRPVRDRISEALRQFVTGQYSPPHQIGLAAGVAAVGLVLGGLVWLERRERWGAATALVVGGAAVLAPLALVPVNDKFLYRNVIAAWIPLAIGLAIVLTSRRTRRVGVVAVAAALAVELSALVTLLHRPAFRRDDWRSATKALGARDDRRVIITQPPYERVSITLYRPGVRSMPPGGTDVREIVFLGFSRLPLRFRPPTGFHSVEQRWIQHVALARYRAASARPVTPAELAARGGFDVDGMLLDSRAAG